MTIVRPIHTDSSPLTQGKRIRLASTRSHFRLIPAHAGKTTTCRPVGRWLRAHPRSRGENSWMSQPDNVHMGSSPLTRGKRNLLAMWLASRVAHPRSRGENPSVRESEKNSGGSSPLTRGKRVVSLGRVLRCRLIPAHAGKTTHPATPASPSWAHPRSRGENR